MATRPPLTPMRNPVSTTAKPPTASHHPHQSVVEALATERKRADDELAHRLAMNVLGLADDPLKAGIEKVIPGRVDVFGNLTKGPKSI